MKIYFHLNNENKITISKNISKDEIEWKTKEILLKKHWEKDGTTKLILTTTQKNEKESIINNTIDDFHIPLLKSALQKSIRRNKTKTAINLSWQLLIQNQDEFLRRIAVIILEDSVLHPNYSLIIWLMIAVTKEWIIKKEQQFILLKIVHDIAKIEFKDEFEQKEFKNVLLNQEFDNNDLVASIILRANYGGMKGDVDFLLNYAMIWYERFEKSKNIIEMINEKTNFFIKNIEVDEYIKDVISKKPLVQDKDKLSEGVDFHVYPNLIKMLIDELNNKMLNFDNVKQSIWNNRSGISLKGRLWKNDYLNIEFIEYKKDQLDDPIWNLIKDKWIKISENDKFWKTVEFEKKRKISDNNQPKITKFFKK
jgi:hypothetical protein